VKEKLIMKSHLILGLVSVALMSGAAVAGDSKKRTAAKDPNEIVCKTEAETGSRLARKKTCMTRAQMEEQRMINRDMIERSQASRTTTGG
jgi:hypothetical protein